MSNKIIKLTISLRSEQEKQRFIHFIKKVKKRGTYSSYIRELLYKAIGENEK